MTEVELVGIFDGSPVFVLQFGQETPTFKTGRGPWRFGRNYFDGVGPPFCFSYVNDRRRGRESPYSAG